MDRDENEERSKLSVFLYFVYVLTIEKEKMNTDWIEDLLFEVAFWFGVSVIVIGMILVVLSC